MKNNKYNYLFFAVVLVFIIGFIFLNTSESEPIAQSTTKKELYPVNTITHGHGLSVDVQHLENVYIATHHGLLLLKSDKDLFQVGDSGDDYMGFSPHPTNPKIFFSSGHPETGGNIGFQKSEDGGYTWKKVSKGVNGPVDFHAMTVSLANPNLIFGWYQGALQRSADEGKNWEIASNTSFPVVGLAADPKNENIIYAASPLGLMVSKNKGKDWNSLLDGFVSTIAINPQNSQEILSYSEKQKLAKSNDGGESWKKINVDFGGETPLYASFSPQQPENIYLLTEKNSIYKSTSSGESWSKVR